MATNNALQWTVTRGARRVSGAEKYFTPSARAYRLPAASEHGR